MSFRNLLEGMVQNGLGGAQSQRRLDASNRNLQSSGLESIFSQLQNTLASKGGASSAFGGSSGAGGSMGGLAEMAKSFLGNKQAGGLSGAHIGGIGAVAGTLFGGGGMKGAAKGGALAILGTLAIGALRNARAKQAGQPVDQAGAQLPPPQEAEEVTDPGMERVLVKAMLDAAKADGRIDKDELSNILGNLGGDDLTAEEKQFIQNEMSAPIDVQGLAAQVRTPAQAAEVYAAALVAIHVDTEEERRFLADLASALRLDQATVEELHRMTGAAG